MFSVPPSHLWVFVTGMMWRTYDQDSVPLTRLNTVAYEFAIADFRRAVKSRTRARSPEPPNSLGGESQDESGFGTPELVERLCDLLGSRLVAYIGAVQDTRTVREWADPGSARTPPDEAADRLRLAYRVAMLLSQNDSAAVVQAWFQGRTPLLKEVSPARLLRDDDSGTAGANVLAAAHAFATGS